MARNAAVRDLKICVYDLTQTNIGGTLSSPGPGLNAVPFLHEILRHGGNDEKDQNPKT